MFRKWQLWSQCLPTVFITLICVKLYLSYFHTNSSFCTSSPLIEVHGNYIGLFIRVLLSESRYPSLVIQVSLSQSHYSSLIIRVSLFESRDQVSLVIRVSLSVGCYPNVSLRRVSISTLSSFFLPYHCSFLQFDFILFKLLSQVLFSGRKKRNYVSEE